jgi:quinol-cytochrome oxidoreductase complex cytochrome b subunit
MLTATRILTHTPLWVFALLAYLIWQGSQSLRPRTQPIWRMLIVPLVFFLMGLSRLVTARDGGIEPLLAWLVAALLFASLAIARAPPIARCRQKKRHRDPSGQRNPSGSQHHGVRAAIRRRGGDSHET